PLPPHPALATRSIIGAGRSAWWQIAVAPASPPAYSHRSLPPSALSCVRQFPRSCRTSLPPGVEAAEHALTDIKHRHVLPPSCRNGGATQIGSKRTFQIKLRDGLT